MARKVLAPFYRRLRFATAAVALVVLNLGFMGVFLRRVCSPGFNCHGCAWATAACPIGAIAYGSAMRSLSIFAIGSVVAVGAVFGRLVCSFVCPFGFFQDLLHKVPSPKIRLPRLMRWGKYAALALLVLLLPWFLGFELSGFLLVGNPAVNKTDSGDIDVVVTVSNPGTEPVVGPVINVIYRSHADESEIYSQRREFAEVTVPPGQTVQLPGFEVPNHLGLADLVVDSPQSQISQRQSYTYFCTLCPAGTLTATIPSYFKARPEGRAVIQRIKDHWLRLSILGAFLVLMVLSSRPFCHVFCPLGACYAATSKASLSGMRLDASACINCGRCEKVCPMDLSVRKEVGSAECIACGDCKAVCPTGGIRRTFGVTA